MAINARMPKVQVPFVDLAAQYGAIAHEIEAATLQALRGTDYILGRGVGLFEEEFAAFCSVKYAVGVDSGTSALELALRAYGVGPGDEVITAASTFVATAYAISYTGATPILVDVDPQTYTIDPARLAGAITHRTRAIIPVHLYGQPADMDPILELAHEHQLLVIEDACQAHGARYKGQRVGSLGDAAAFSFYPAKNLGAYGDGGVVVTNSERVADSIRMLRNYGQREKYHHELRGYNRRLDTLQAAVLRVKLKYLDSWNTARRQRADIYRRLLTHMGVVTPSEADYAESVWHLYVIRSAQRNALQAFLADRGVATGIHYPIPIHLQPAYRDLGYTRGSFPITERLAAEGLSLPMYPELGLAMLEHIVAAVADFGAKYSAAFTHEQGGHASQWQG